MKTTLNAIVKWLPKIFVDCQCRWTTPCSLYHDISTIRYDGIRYMWSHIWYKLYGVVWHETIQWIFPMEGCQEPIKKFKENLNPKPRGGGKYLKPLVYSVVHILYGVTLWDSVCRLYTTWFCNAAALLLMPGGFIFTILFLRAITVTHHKRVS